MEALGREAPTRTAARWLRPSAWRDRAWVAALEEHDQVLARYLVRLRGVPAERWHEPAAEGKWSPAEVALHLALAYEVGRDACSGGQGMRMRVSPAVAWLSRTVMLPVILRTRTFPRGAPAPREVRPAALDARGMSKEALEARLRLVGADAASALRAAADRTPPPRFVHAYFGRLAPLTTLRLLSAHTRHHTGVRY